LTTIALSATYSLEQATQEHMKQFSGLEALGINGYSISIEPCPWGAYCEFSDKKVVLDPALFKNSQISPRVEMSVLHELGNLSQESDFRSLRERASQMSPDEFVSDYERIEHRSALIAKKILRDYYPVEKWSECPFAYTPEAFELHYFLQQLGGHSQDIFNRHSSFFDKHINYNGTWKNPPIPEDEDQFLRALIDLRIRSEDPERDVSEPALKKYQDLKSYIYESSQNSIEKNLYTRLKSRIEEIERAPISGRSPPASSY
jgi:hypothetical protein